MQTQTPKNFTKNSTYTSPIGLLKNYNTLNSNANNSYQQQFFKIKSQRLQSEMQELRQENALLKTKLTDSSTTNQMLKQKIYVLEHGIERAQRSYTHRTVPSFITDSGYPSANSSGRGSPQSKYYSGSVTNQKSQRSAYNSQLERLLKQNRILKNQHEMQMTKLRDENKKLNRKILELEQKSNKKSSQSEQFQEKIYRQKQQQRYLKIQKANNQLRKDNEQLEKQKKKIEQKLKNLQEKNQTLKKQNEELNALNSARSRNQSNLHNQADIKQKQYKQKINQLQNQIQQILAKQRIQSPLTIQRSNITTQQKRSQQNLTTNIFTAENPKLEKQVQLLKRKITLQEHSLSQKEQEIKNILIKLKPLLQKQKNNKANKDETVIDSKRASLSLLQVFLSKYKINSF